MDNDLVKQFLDSGEANQLVRSLAQNQGLTPQQAQGAVKATAEGTATTIQEKGIDVNNLGAGMLGALAGAVGLGKPGGLPPEIVQGITDKVSNMTGLSPATCSTVVNLVLPKVVEFMKGQIGKP
jgi:nucleoid DNA-binding protein